METLDWCIEVLAVIDICINTYCLYYVQKTFNVHQCMIYILCLDSSITAAASLLIFITNLIQIRTPFMCSVLTFGLLIISTLFVKYNFIIAYIRYKKIWTSMSNATWKTEKQLIRSTNISLIFTTIVLLLVIIFNAIFDWRVISLYNQCMGSNEVAITGMVVIGIRLFIILGTVTIDVKCLLLVRSYQKSHRKTNGTILTETPCRATLLNCAIFLFSVIYIPIAVSNGEFLKLAMLGQLLVFMIKSPFIIFLTFRVNQINARINQEVRRQQVLEDAQKRRAERLSSDSK